MRTKYSVMLTEEERARLQTLVGQGTAPARLLTHARILLKANQGAAGPGWTDAAIATALDVSLATVARVRQRYVRAGLDAALARRRRSSSRSRAARPPTGRSAGVCACWPSGWSPWRWWTPSRTRRCARS